jgi:quinol monooxygenase YgiN
MKTQHLALVCAAITSSVSLGCSSSNDTASSNTSGGEGGGASGAVYTALSLGTLKNDEAGSKTLHDMVVGAASQQAMASGDLGHEPLLGMDTAAGAPLQFLAIDRWTSVDGFNTFVASPPMVDFISNFYTAPPDVSVWQTRPDWTTWGSPADEAPSAGGYVITLRGQYAGDEASAMKTHNGIVASIPAPGAVALGNIAHLLFANPSDPSELLIIEVWTNETSQEQTYMALGPAIAQLWNGMPTITRWRTTDWARW